MKQKEMGDGDKRKKRAQDRRGLRASMPEGRATGSINGGRERERLRWYERWSVITEDIRKVNNKVATSEMQVEQGDEILASHMIEFYLREHLDALTLFWPMADVQGPRSMKLPSEELPRSV